MGNQKETDENGEEIEIDISTIDLLYDQIARSFTENSGIKPPPATNSDAKVITQEELFDLMKKQLLKGESKN